MNQSRREFVRILFIASQAAAASRLLPASLLADEVPSALSSSASPAGLNFLVFGDWGRRGQADQVQVAAQMARAAKDIGARFVISFCDNFYEDGVASTQDEHWRVSFEAVYAAPSLQVPWHVILGNHDYYGDCDAQIAYSKTSRRWNMPARYFVQTHQLDAGASVDFFYLDTTPMIKVYQELTRGNMGAKVGAQSVPEQLTWLRRVLAASKAQWKIVIGHHPIYSGGNKQGNTTELIAQVLPLLREFKVQAYFNGHDHDLQHLVAGNLNFFGSGAGSIVSSKTYETQYTQFARNCPGFTTVSLQPDKMMVRMIDGSGKQLHSATVPRIPA